MPKPICFMIMPYGTKPTGSKDPGVPAEIDCNALWEKALRPAIEALDMEAVRADQDWGALIIHEMIERLAISDFVVADVTIPNGNVYYEVGIRHAAQRKGCVMVAAKWSRQLFDIDQMRRVTYPLPEGAVTDETAAAIRDALKPEVLRPMLDGESPFYAVLPDFPRFDLARTQTFRSMVDQLAAFQADVRAVRVGARAERAAKALALVERYRAAAGDMPAVALELLGLLRDLALWPKLAEMIAALPAAIRSLSFVRELSCLADSKQGDHEKAIGALEELIALSGDSSERRGLLGGRYKALYRAATDPVDKAMYLDKAIEQYEMGMYQDLNDYYPSCNLPRLHRLRGLDHDEERARLAANVAMLACLRAKDRGQPDPWLLPTLLGMAFETGDAAAARDRYREVVRGGPQAFQLETTIPDLETTLGLLKDPAQVAALRPILDDLKALIPATPQAPASAAPA